MNSKIKLVYNLIASFFACFAIMNIGHISTANIILLCLFGAAFVLISKREAIVGQQTKRTRTVSMITAILFATIYTISNDLSAGLNNRLFIAVYYVCTFLGLYVVFYETLVYILGFFAQKKTPENEGRRPFSLRILGIYSGIVLLCCIPMFLLNLPGVMTPDSLSQFRQIMGEEILKNHHPWIHTLTMGLFINAGMAVSKNVYFAISFYTVFQMIMVSLGIGYTIECMYEWGISKSFRIFAMIAFVLCPYNLIYSVTLWKDVLFSIATLVFTVTLIRVQNEWKIRDKVLFVISALGMCFYRHNGYYAYILTILCLLIANRKRIINYAIYGLSVWVLVVIINGPVANAIGVVQPSFAFGMTMPLQQIGCVVANNGKISDDQIDFLNSVNDISLMADSYEPECEDPLLDWATGRDEYYLDYHKGEFISTWVNIGVNNPGLYIRAFIEQSKGYWTPMAPQQTVFYGITEGNSSGLETKPIIAGPVLIKINELLFKLHTMIPIYGILYSCGSCFWIMVVAIVAIIDKKEYYKLQAILPVFFVTLSVIAAAPLVADLRYAYQLMIAIPLFIALAFARPELNIIE